MLACVSAFCALASGCHPQIVEILLAPPAPTLTISSPSSSSIPAGGSSVTYTLTYTDVSSISLKVTDLTLNKTGTANAAVASSCNLTTLKCTVTISGATGVGTLGISVASGTGIGSDGSTVKAAGPSTTFSVGPLITISAPSLTTTATGPVTYTVTYKYVTSVSLILANITLVSTGTAAGTKALSCGSLSGGTETCTVTISSTTGNGTLGFTIPAGTAADGFSNQALAATATTFIVQQPVPIVTISAPSVTSTNVGPVTYTVNYANITSLTLVQGNITLNHTGSATGTVAVSCGSISGNAASCTVTINPISGAGTLGITIAANTAAGPGGNATGAGPSATVTVTLPPPAITVPSANTYISSTSDSTTYTVSGTCPTVGVALTVQVDGVKAPGLATATCGGLGTWSSTIDSTQLSEGSHSMLVHPASGTNSVAISIFRQPNQPFIGGWSMTGPITGTLSTSNNPHFTIPATSLDAGSTGKVYTDASCSSAVSSTFTLATSPVNVTDVSFLTTGADNGIKTFYSEINDLAGNSNQCCALDLSYNFQASGTGISLTVLSGATPKVAFTAVGGATGYTCFVVGQTSTAYACSSGDTITTDGSTSLPAGYDGSLIVRAFNGGGQIAQAEKPFRVGQMPRGTNASTNSILQIGNNTLWTGAFTAVTVENAPGILKLKQDGKVDPTVDYGTGFDKNVEAAILVPGSTTDMYVGGEFTKYKGVSYGRILRIDSSGNAVGSFIPGTGFDDAVLVIVPVPGGSGDIYVGGKFNSYKGTPVSKIVRLDATGALVGSFNASVGQGNEEVLAIAPAPDGSGKIYVGGSFTYQSAAAHPTPNSIVRLNTDGSADGAFVGIFNGFGLNGSVYSIVGVPGSATDIYVGGYFTQYAGGSTSLAVVNQIIRLTPAGNLVNTFNTGTGGNAFESGTGVNTIVPLDSSGATSTDVYIGGTFQTYKAENASGVARLTLTGGMSTTAPFIKTASGFSGTYSINAIVPAADGSGDLYIAGFFTGYNGVPTNGLIRLDNQGNIKCSFTGGQGIDNLADAAVAQVVPLTDGSHEIYVVGSDLSYRLFQSYKGYQAEGLALLTQNGDLVDGFSSLAQWDENAVTASLVAAGGSGDIYVGGAKLAGYNNFTTYNDVFRISSTGSLITGFSTGTGFSPTNRKITSIIQVPGSTSDIFVGGSFTGYNGNTTNVSNVVRLDVAGARVSSFNTGSGASGGFSAGSTVNALLSVGDGTNDIYVAGDFTTYNRNGTPQNVGPIVRLNTSGGLSANGSFDTYTSLGTNGTAVCKIFAMMFVPSSTDLYVAGQCANNVHIVRITSTGTLVGGFSMGVAFQANDRVNAITAVPGGGGDIYVAGDCTSSTGASCAFTNRIVRVTSTGSVVAGFNVGTGFDAAIRSLLPVTVGTGSVYVAGDFKLYNGSVRPHMIRLNSDGSVDETFQGQKR